MLSQLTSVIIGGADGPTAIFVTGSKFPTVGLIIALGVVVALGILVYYLKHRK